MEKPAAHLPRSPAGQRWSLVVRCDYMSRLRKRWRLRCQVGVPRYSTGLFVHASPTWLPARLFLIYSWKQAAVPHVGAVWPACIRARVTCFGGYGLFGVCIRSGSRQSLPIYQQAGMQEMLGGVSAHPNDLTPNILKVSASVADPCSAPSRLGGTRLALSALPLCLAQLFLVIKHAGSNQSLNFRLRNTRRFAYSNAAPPFQTFFPSTHVCWPRTGNIVAGWVRNPVIRNDSISSHNLPGYSVHCITFLASLLTHLPA